MNILRIRFPDRVEDIELKAFDDLTIDDVENIAREQQPGEPNVDVLYRRFGIPHDLGRYIAAHHYAGLQRAVDDWREEGNRTLAIMEGIREACDAHEDRRLDAIKAVWESHRPGIRVVRANGQIFHVPQDIGIDVNYAQWVNLQVAIDRRALVPDPEVEGDKGRPGTNMYEFYRDVLACMLTSEFDPKEWNEDPTKPDDEAARFKSLFESRTSIMRHVRIADAIEVCAWLLMQRFALDEECRPGLPKTAGVAAAQIIAGNEYFSRRWGAYSQLAEPAAHYNDLKRIHGDRGLVTNYPAGAVLRHMGYLAERARFDAATQRALMPAAK